VEDGARWLDSGKCSFVGLESVGEPFLHKSRGRLICKIFLLRKCQSGGALGQLSMFVSPSVERNQDALADYSTNISPPNASSSTME
jgi:hypothetical protein